MEMVNKRGRAMKTVLGCLVLALLLLGGSLSNHSFAQEELEVNDLLEVRLGFTDPDATYLLNPAQPDEDPITAVVTFENVSSRELLATQGYADNLHLLLRIKDPKGLQITAQNLLPSTYQRTLGVVIEVDKFVEADLVEVVPWGGETVSSFSFEVNLRHFYNFLLPGTHTAQLFAPVGLYEISSGIPDTDYARFGERIAEGDIISNALPFTLVDDADGDGYCFPVQHSLLCPGNPEPDCEDRPDGADGDPGTADDGANLNSAQAEIPNNGLDDDCNPATSDSQLVDFGTIFVRAVKRTVGLGSHPGSTSEPIANLHIRIFDKSPDSCLMRRFGVSHHHYKDVWDGCPNVRQGDAWTDVEGTASVDVAAPGDYVLIAQHDGVYMGVSAGDLQVNQTMRKHLQYIVKANGKKVPAKYTEKKGSELLIIEPEYVEWDSSEELYPFVFESVGDWSVGTAVSPPEGFVADHDSLSEDVFTEVEAVQFTITDVGSKWEATEVTHDLQHKKRKERVRSKVDVKLSPQLAEQLGLTVWGKPLEEEEGKGKGKGKGKEE
jgi:hypothetical protein